MIRYWKEIKGYEGKYKISNYGEVVSLPRYKQNHYGLYKIGKVYRWRDKIED